MSTPHLLWQLTTAIEAGVRVILTHELDKLKGGCDFERFFTTTPRHLIDNGLYKAIAIPLYP
jgi:hypothetical protein